MKIVKKVVKCLLCVVLIVVIALGIYNLFPLATAMHKIDGIEDSQKKVSEIEVSDQTKIFALGEASHGNHEFQDLKLEVFDNLVENDGYRTFVLECDYGEGLKLNAYIHHEMDINPIDTFSFDIYHSQEMLNLIDWMKNYNLVHPDDMVSFYGMDIQNPASSIEMIDGYCKKNGIVVDSAIHALLMKNSVYAYNQNEINQIESYMHDLQSKISDETIVYATNNIINGLEYVRIYQNHPGESNQIRDEYMANTVSWIQQHEDKPIMVSAHNGHVSKTASYTNMGTLLKQSYGDAYKVIGTDYFMTLDNISTGNRRMNLFFYSCDTLAYQAKYTQENRYYLDFTQTSTKIQDMIHSSMSSGSLGEGFDWLMYVLPTRTTMIYTPPVDMYDGMIYVYFVHPIHYKK